MVQAALSGNLSFALGLRFGFWLGGVLLFVWPRVNESCVWLAVGLALCAVCGLCCFWFDAKRGLKAFKVAAALRYPPRQAIQSLPVMKVP